MTWSVTVKVDPFPLEVKKEKIYELCDQAWLNEVFTGECMIDYVAKKLKKFNGCVTSGYGGLLTISFKSEEDYCLFLLS